MRRLARHVVCTIALLLIWVAVASADGGWVLWVWKYTVAGAGTRLHEVDSVHVSRNACDIALVQRAHILAADGYRPMVTGTKPNRSLLGRKENEAWSYRCLPDTVDPRGSKGK